MKTINHSSKIMRIIGIVAFSFMLVSLLILVLLGHGGESKIALMALCIIPSIFLGMILAYGIALSWIKSQIVSSFTSVVKITAKDQTIISGNLIFVTEDLKLRSIFVENSSFNVEPKEIIAESGVQFPKQDYTLLIGSSEILK
jgi:hypothetical protein